MNSAEGNIADFFAEVVVMFDAEAQFTKLQDQLRNFSARIGAITIPVRLTGVNDASLEMSAMRDFGAPAGRRRSGGLTENQWESQTTRSMLAQGYKMGEGGWYKPAGEEVGAAAASSRGLGMLSGIGGLLGFAGSMAAFTGIFAAVGDLVQGAHYDQQLAVLKQLIPNQQQYAQALSTINEVANTAGTNIMDTAHSYVSFANAAQIEGISAEQTNQSFKALTYAIAGSGSQSQAGRIFADYGHMILGGNVSFSKISQSELGRYLKIPQLLEQLPQFKGEDLKQLSAAFNDLTKAQQLTLINTVLLSRYQGLAAASADTAAGRFVVLENQLKTLGGTITDAASPTLKVGLDIASLAVGAITTDILTFQWAGEEFNKYQQKTIDWLQNKGQSFHFVREFDHLAAVLIKNLANQFNYQGNSTLPPKQVVEVNINNKHPNATVSTSVKPPSSQASRTYARTK